MSYQPDGAGHSLELRVAMLEIEVRYERSVRRILTALITALAALLVGGSWLLACTWSGS